MAQRTSIQWTDHTFNGIIGCTKVSPACRNCYAEVSSPVRVSRKIGLELWGPKALRRSASEQMWKELYKWNRLAEGKPHKSLVFCYSLGDVFEDYAGDIVNHRGEPLFGKPTIDEFYDDAQIGTEVLYPVVMSDVRFRLFRAIGKCKNLIFQLLTKRPENVRSMVPNHWINGQWPSNAWIGTTMENQECANERMIHLHKIPAPVRFASVEPMLGPIDIREWQDCLQWVICGGESLEVNPTQAVPMDMHWVHDLRNQCQRTDIPFFFKQWGNWVNFHDLPLLNDEWLAVKEIKGATYYCLGKKKTGCLLSGKRIHEFPSQRYQ